MLYEPLMAKLYGCILRLHCMQCEPLHFIVTPNKTPLDWPILLPPPLPYSCHLCHCRDCTATTATTITTTTAITTKMVALWCHCRFRQSLLLLLLSTRWNHSWGVVTATTVHWHQQNCSGPHIFLPTSKVAFRVL